MLLRDVELGDVDAYVRMRCDPVMMAKLGGPSPRDGIEAKVRSDVDSVAAGTAWISMIVPDPDVPRLVAGSVVVWSHELDGAQISEVGWMVLPEYQGRGVGKQAMRTLLTRARDEGRWGTVHAFPGVDNGPSNGICRTLGFTSVGPKELPFNGQLFHANHWLLAPPYVGERG
ncbi:MAG: GNAT family N-acetyltransferase [Actinocatenispora sp.]